MGNCQAAAAAATVGVVIRHPGGAGNKVDRIYWPVTAEELMNSNPGHYVAQEVEVEVAAADAQGGAPPVRQLKLLRPGETLAIGNVYRLISFEDVLKVFAVKKSVRLGKLLKESGAPEPGQNRAGSESVPDPGQDPNSLTGYAKMAHEVHHLGGRWRPALQSIAELG